MYEKAANHFERRHKKHDRRQVAADNPKAADPLATPGFAVQTPAPAAAAGAAAQVPAAAAAVPAAAATTPAAVAPVVETTTARRRTKTTPAAVAAVPATASVAPAVVVTPVTSLTTTPARAAATSARVVSTSSVSSSSSSTTASAAAAKDANKTSSSNAGTIAGVIIAVVAVIALVGGFFLWRKKRSKRDSAHGFIGGYQKQDESRDPYFDHNNNSSQAHFNNGDSYTNEKHSYGTYGAMAAGAGAGALAAGAAMHHYDQRQQQQHSPFQPAHNTTQQPWNSNMSYPPSNAANASSAHLMGGSDRAISPPASQPQFEKQIPPTPGAVAPVPVATQQPGPDGPFGESEGQGEVRVVKRSFEPSPDMDDELWIQPGDRVQILMAYDDGWCLCQHMDYKPGKGPLKGVIPNDCISDDVPLNTAGMPLDNIREEDEHQSFVSAAQAPQLGPIRPMSDSFSAQQQSGSAAPPAIHIATPSMTDLEAMTRSGHQRLSIGPNGQPVPLALTPGTASATPDASMNGKSSAKVKRTSSLIASRDANLFVELGRALDNAAEAAERQHGTVSSVSAYSHVTRPQDH